MSDNNNPEDGQAPLLDYSKEELDRVAAEKAKLKEQFEKGEINVAEYNGKVMNLMTPPSDRPKPKPRKKGGIKLLIILIIIVIIAAIPAMVNLNWRFYFQNTLTASMVPDYYEDHTSTSTSGPIQIGVDGKENGEYKGRPLGLTYKDYYDITGTVVSVHDYWGLGDYDTLVPRDVCIAWGSLADAYQKHETEFYQEGRFCHGKVVDSDLDPSEVFTYRNAYNQIVSSITSMSNNHLIPSTTDVRSDIFNLKAGDKVRITGYLVKAHYGDLQLDSSTSRTAF